MQESLSEAAKNLRAVLDHKIVAAALEELAEPNRQEEIRKLINDLETDNVTELLADSSIEPLLSELGRTKRNKPIRGIPIMVGGSHETGTQ